MAFSFTLSKEDRDAVIAIICTMLGIGSLSMGHHLARSGATFGISAIVIFCGLNSYATILLTRCFASSPSHVKTYTDLGRHIAGTPGAVAVISMHLGTCSLLPIVFLILGGELLLPTFFKGAVTLDATWWILIYAIMLWPMLMLRSVKEASWTMICGALTAFFSVCLAVGEAAADGIWTEMEPTVVNGWNVLSTFGSVSLAYGAALTVPSIYREHSNPTNMPFVVTLSICLVTVVYLAIGVFGYAQYGCAAKANLLTAMEHHLPKALAYFLMFVHICMACIIISSPFTYFIELHAFRLGQPSLAEAAEEKTLKMMEALAPEAVNSGVKDADAPLTKKERLVSFLFRTTVIFTQCFIAIMFQSSFSDVADFVGATTLSWSCVLLPCAFYLKMFFNKISLPNKMFIMGIITISFVCGCYAAYGSLTNVIDKASRYRLFQPIAEEAKKADIAFPYCPAGFKERHLILWQ